MEAKQLKELRDEFHVQNSSFLPISLSFIENNIPITLYVGIPRTPPMNGFSLSEVYALYSSSSIPSINESADLLELEHPDCEFVVQPSDVHDPRMCDG